MQSEGQTLEFTGERYVPGIGEEIAYEHLHRYALACRLAEGKRVLDAASGEGYGTALLAQSAREVVGVDISPEAIAHARRKYGGRDGIRFREASVSTTGLEERSFDLVVSFETLEHVTEQQAVLQEFRRVLKDDGVLVISTPNVEVYGDQREEQNEYHEKELTQGEFLELLHTRFRSVRLLGQRITCASHVWPVAGRRAAASPVHFQGDDRVTKAAPEVPYAPSYFLAVCTDGDVGDDRLGESLFTTFEDDLYHQFFQWRGAAEKLRAELDAFKRTPAYWLFKIGRRWRTSVRRLVGLEPWRGGRP